MHTVVSLNTFMSTFLILYFNKSQTSDRCMQSPQCLEGTDTSTCRCIYLQMCQSHKNLEAPTDEESPIIDFLSFPETEGLFGRSKARRWAELTARLTVQGAIDSLELSNCLCAVWSRDGVSLLVSHHWSHGAHSPRPPPCCLLGFLFPPNKVIGFAPARCQLNVHRVAFSINNEPRAAPLSIWHVYTREANVNNIWSALFYMWLKDGVCVPRRE